ncbi:septation protein SepH, partial [Micromonospora sp. CV4]
MRPVRFVALSEDGHALVLADEVGRLLALPIDERIAGALHAEPGAPPLAVAPTAADPVPSLSPRDIQARIRSGESAEDVARIAGVPVDRVLRYAGPVLQERAMLAQHARRTRLKGAEKPTPLAEVVNGRLSQHGIDTEKISWDAYRRDDGTWRIIATWPSGKATAQAIWDLDKTRQAVTPHDDMAQYLCAERPTPILGQEPAPERGGHALPGPSRGEPSRGGHGLPAASEHPRPGRDPIRAGRDALLASLDRPLGASSG